MVDPQFCDLDANDVSLLEDSPLLAVLGCGLVGALGLGCGATPVLVALMRAEPSAEGIRIEWQWGGLELPTIFWIERADDSAGHWVRITTARFEEYGITVDVDRHVEPGRSYLYRLAWITENGDPAWSEVVAATALQSSKFAIESITPNPASGLVEIAWSLPRAGEVDLAVFDVAGREVARLADGRFAPGSHRSTWDGRIASGLAAPGAYLVRLRHDRREVTRRLLLRR